MTLALGIEDLKNTIAPGTAKNFPLPPADDEKKPRVLLRRKLSKRSCGDNSYVPRAFVKMPNVSWRHDTSDLTDDGLDVLDAARKRISLEADRCELETGDVHRFHQRDLPFRICPRNPSRTGRQVRHVRPDVRDVV